MRINEYRSKPTMEKLRLGGRWVRKRRNSEGRKNEMKRGGRRGRGLSEY